ncbi:MAG: rRNA maturation RNase YbeY [Crocinitomicaceae bacterium]|nr:rRNA maturation RNase YbeY [Crocinitomicaceae bacterium]
MDNISYNFIDIEIPGFDPEFFDLWISNVVNSYDRELGELSFVFSSDDYLLDINKKHLDHDFYTDIITFDYCVDDVLNGDLFISYDRVKENAVDYGNQNVFDELCRVMIHGVLHLIGFKDKSEEDEGQMRIEEIKSLSLRNVSRET